MQTSWRIGSLFGIPLFLDSSWFIILAFVTIANAFDFYPALGSVLAGSAGLLLALLLFGSVLLHELGHSLVARSQGIAVNSITLFMFGGIASIEKESKTPGEAFQVAIAGPAVSMALFGLFFLFAKLVPPSGILRVIAIDLARINLVLALFNLIPGLPLDGGQVLKAGIWKLTGNRFQAVRWSAKTGKILGGLAIALGIATVVYSNDYSGLWVTFIGGFIFRNANKYEQITSLQEALLQLVATDAMSTEFRVVDADMSLRQFADEYILSNTSNGDGTPLSYSYYAASDGRYRGLVVIEDLNFIERSLWETQTVHKITRSLSEIISVQEKTPLSDAINSMESHHLKRLTVLSPAGTVAGVIDKSDITRAVAAKLNLSMSEAEIKQIKLDGQYSPKLQLEAIAKSTSET